MWIRWPRWPRGGLRLGLGRRPYERGACRSRSRRLGGGHEHRLRRRRCRCPRSRALGERRARGAGGPLGRDDVVQIGDRVMKIHEISSGDVRREALVELTAQGLEREVTPSPREEGRAVVPWPWPASGARPRSGATRSTTRYARSGAALSHRSGARARALSPRSGPRRGLPRGGSRAAAVVARADSARALAFVYPHHHHAGEPPPWKRRRLISRACSARFVSAT